ncbi:MAG: hypothetical protein ACI8PZ_001180 [Myxococcota bacterium]|jgi:hypothetical protein
MFGWLRPDPVKRLEKRYQAKMKEAYDAEKFGDRVRQAGLYAEAEAIRVELDALKAAAAT